MSTDRIPLGVLTPKPKALPQPEQPCPVPLDQLKALVEAGAVDVVLQLIEKHSLPYKIEGNKLVDSLKGTDLYLTRFITKDPACLEMKSDVIKLAKCPNEILITGATGTGKEILARAMIGDRQGSFIAVNCAGLPEQLIESELFGHERGAFTGAESAKQGLCQAAKDGVLFLDEIGELPISVQAKLLRALQDKRVRRVGSLKEEEINCKFVCATHRNLRQMVKEEKFREDLFARISTFELHIPSLTQRQCDILPLILNEKGGDKFLEALKKENGRLDDIDLSFNVRSIQRVVARFNVLGKVILK